MDTCPSHAVPDNIVNNNEQIGDQKQKGEDQHTALSYLQVAVVDFNRKNLIFCG